MLHKTNWLNIIFIAFKLSLSKFNIKNLKQNIILFMVHIAAVIATILWILSFFDDIEHNSIFSGLIALFLWLTIWASYFADALSEVFLYRDERFLLRLQSHVKFRRLNLSPEILGTNNIVKESEDNASWRPSNLSLSSLDSMCSSVALNKLKKHDLVLVKEGESVAFNGIVIAAGVKGQSKEDNNNLPLKLKAGDIVKHAFLVIRIESIPLIGGYQGSITRHKTVNEEAISIFILAMALIFILVTASMLPFSQYAVASNQYGSAISYIALMALFVCLLPTTICGLLSSARNAAMGRLFRNKTWARSSNVVELSGDVDVLFLDKTGTITFGNRKAINFHPCKGISIEDLAKASLLASLGDNTQEGQSIVFLAKNTLSSLNKAILHKLPQEAKVIPFNANNRMSGVDYLGHKIRKGSYRDLTSNINLHDNDIINLADTLASKGATPLLVIDGKKALGLIELVDKVKPLINKRISTMRSIGIKTVMVTGDNPLTAAAIAAEAGVDDFISEANAQTKLLALKSYQKHGYVVAMAGDGDDDIPALLQSDVALAMGEGSFGAQAVANMIDLDSSPTKLIDIVEIGKQMLITRGCILTFALANDIAKYFALLPSALAFTYPSLEALNIMNLSSPNSALLSTVIFNFLIILLLLPLSLKGVRYKLRSASVLLRRNLFLYGVGGVIIPFIAIKLIDMVLGFLGLV